MIKKIFNFVRIIIALVLCYWLLRKIDIKTSFSIMKQVNLGYFVLGMVLFFIFLLICNWRWKLLLDVRGLRYSFSYLLKVYFISWFFNNILPTTVGGDVLRIAYTVQRDKGSNQSKTSLAVAVTLIDRFIGFIGLFFFACVASALLFITKNGTNQYLYFVISGLIVLLIIMLALFSDRVHRLFSWFFAHLKIFHLGARFEKAYQEIKDFRNVKLQLLYSFVLSIFVQISLALVWFACAIGISVKTSLLYYFLYIPVIGVLTMIPITIGGLGLRENLFVELFSAQGMTTAQAAAVSLLYLIINLIYGIIGGIMFLFVKKDSVKLEN